MILNLPNQDKLFQQQKKLIKVISFVSGNLILIAGTALQIINPDTALSLPLRLCFVFLFFLTSFVASVKSIPTKMAELMLASMGSLLIAKLLFLFYQSGLPPALLLHTVLVIVGLSGVFISKSSLLVLFLPGFAYIAYSLFNPVILPQLNPLLSFVFLFSSGIVGYFLTWQKIQLIRKGMEEEIHKNTVIQNLQEGVLLRDANGIILATNPAAIRMLELNEVQLLGRRLSDTDLKIYKEDGISIWPAEELPTSIAIKTGKSINNFPVVLIKSDKTIAHIEVSATPIFSPLNSKTVESILVTMNDVTELKKARNSIENSQLQLLAHSKLTSLGEMASGIAHEINNPLTIILGRAQHSQLAVEKGFVNPKELMLSFSKISETALRISKIVKSMKSLSRNESNEFAVANLKSIMEDILTVSNDYIQKNDVRVENKIDPSIELDCNAGLLSQVFINLMGNAMDALKELKNEKWIKIESSLTDNAVTIAFHDSGTGIPAHLKDKIMLPFFTTKEAGKGTGIGLSLCQSIVNNHNGRLFIDDSVSHTCFKIVLPLESVRSTNKIAA